MPDLIKQVQGDIAVLRESIEKDAELLLKQLDLERMLTEPGYIVELSAEFVAQHAKEIAAASKLGEVFAKTVIRNGRQDGR